MNPREFAANRENLVRSPNVTAHELKNAEIVKMAFDHILRGVNFRHITFAGTTDADYVLLTSEDNATLGVVAEKGSFIAVDGTAIEGSDRKKVQVAFREDTTVPRLNMALSASVGQDITSRHSTIEDGVSPGMTSPDEYFETEILSSVGPTEYVRPSFWTEYRVDVVAEDGGAITIRADRGSLLAVFAANGNEVVSFEHAPEAPVSKLNYFSDAQTIPAVAGSIAINA